MDGDRGAFDPRITPARGDIAAAELEGRVAAERYVAASDTVVCVPVAPVSARPDGSAGLTSQLLYGERVRVYEVEGQWAWGQAVLDDYVGYVPRACLDDPAGLPEPTYRVAATSAHVYATPSFKGRPAAALPYGARLPLGDEVVWGDGGQVAFRSLATGGFVACGHVAPLDEPASDWVAEAERFLGVPYLWGGRSSTGIDCSGLLQTALQAAGLDCPRDSDQQAAAVGETLPDDAALRRGDIVFWEGHCGIMTAARTLLHANIHHMTVAKEPLAGARRRIARKGGGDITRKARLS